MINYLFTFPKDGEKREPPRVGAIPKVLEPGDVIEFGTPESGAFLHRVQSVVWVGPVAKSVGDLHPDEDLSLRGGYSAIVAVARR